MDGQDNGQFDSDYKIHSELVIEENKTDEAVIETAQNEPEPHLQVENNTEVYTELENQNEVVVEDESNGQLYIYERNENEQGLTENAAEFIQVCDSNNAFEEMNNSTEKEVSVDGLEEFEKYGVKDEYVETANHEKCVNDERKDISENSEGSQLKNYKSVILEDWEVEVPHIMGNHESENYTETVVVSEEPQVLETQEVIAYNNDNCTVVDVTALEEVEVVNDNPKDENSQETLNPDQITLLAEKKLESLKYPRAITKNDIVKILDETSERVVRPIAGGKDLFFSLELSKRLNQKLTLTKNRTSETVEKSAESDSCNNNNTVDDCQKIVDILEADDIKDWKSVPSNSEVHSKENGNVMEISKAIKDMQEVDAAKNTPAKTPRKTPLKKFRIMDKEMERTLALQQLREEFPSNRKRSRTTKKVNHIPFLASTVLEKALTSPEVTTALKPGPPRRRPCYLPENVESSKVNEEVGTSGNKTRKGKGKGSVESQKNAAVSAKKGRSSSDLPESDSEISTTSMPNPVVKTYSVKRKSTDVENDIKSTLETIAAVTKALNESVEEAGTSKPKKQKTIIRTENKNNVLVKGRKKIKSGSSAEKKAKSEVEKLLGDEGAIRMLYDTQHLDGTSSSPKKTKFRTTTGVKKDLVLKTKLVKNAVMRLSGVGADGVFLRGQRRSLKAKPEVIHPKEEPLFTSTPNVVLYKPKKKQQAEASRILYRHSSSESFDSSEGYRRTSFDADGLNLAVKDGPALKSEEQNSVLPEGEKSPGKAKQKKNEILISKKLKRLERVKNLTKQRKESKATAKGKERLSTDSVSTSGSRLNLSNVPVRKSSRSRMVSKKYSIWSSTSMDSLSVGTLGLKKPKKASTELGKKLNCKELTILQYEQVVQVILSPSSTLLKNSLNLEVLKELHQVFSYLSNEDSCNVVLLSSHGNTFCQGVDINRIISFSDSEREKGISQLITSIRDFITSLVNFNKPLIAGVHAAAVGLGVTLLPYCDLVISSDTASFFTPYVKLGQAPEGAPTHTFPRISRLLVSELLFKSHKMSAADALKLGLVTQIIPEERFEQDLIMIARNMAAQSVQGMQSVKVLLRSGTEQEDISEALRLEGELLKEHWKDADSLNNMVKFLNSGELQLKQSNS